MHSVTQKGKTGNHSCPSLLVSIVSGQRSFNLYVVEINGHPL